MRYTVVVTEDPEEKGVFNASVPALPGLHVWGETVAGAIRNAKDAMEAYLIDMLDVGDPFPENT